METSICSEPRTVFLSGRRACQPADVNHMDGAGGSPSRRRWWGDGFRGSLPAPLPLARVCGNGGAGPGVLVQRELGHHIGPGHVLQEDAVRDGGAELAHGHTLQKPIRQFSSTRCFQSFVLFVMFVSA